MRSSRMSWTSTSEGCTTMFGWVPASAPTWSPYSQKEASRGCHVQTGIELGGQLPVALCCFVALTRLASSLARDPSTPPGGFSGSLLVISADDHPCTSATLWYGVVPRLFRCGVFLVWLFIAALFWRLWSLLGIMQFVAHGAAIVRGQSQSS